MGILLNFVLPHDIWSNWREILIYLQENREINFFLKPGVEPPLWINRNNCQPANLTCMWENPSYAILYHATNGGELSMHISPRLSFSCLSADMGRSKINRQQTLVNKHTPHACTSLLKQNIYKMNKYFVLHVNHLPYRRWLQHFVRSIISLIFSICQNCVFHMSNFVWKILLGSSVKGKVDFPCHLQVKLLLRPRT